MGQTRKKTKKKASQKTSARKLNKLNFGEYFFSEKKKVYLFDLDGTLYLGGQVLPGALKLIRRLRALKKNIFFFTNNSSRSHYDYLQKLNGFGFDVSLEEIVMSTHTLIRFLKAKSWSRVYIVGTPSMEQMLRGSNILMEEDKPSAVVIGFDKTLTYAKLERACRLVNQGVPYIVTHPDLYCPTDQGPEPDCGAFAKVIELVTKKNPLVVLGKPHLSMVEEVLHRVPCRLKDMILIGDRLSTDIAMGRKAGIDTVLVLSGETTRADLRKRTKIHPKWIIDSVADLLPSA